MHHRPSPHLRIPRGLASAAGLLLTLYLLPAAPVEGQLAPPYGLAANANNGTQQIQVTWQMDQSLPYVGFRVFRRQALANSLWTQADLTSANLVHETGNRNLRLWNDSGLPTGVPFNYTVCAVYDANEGVSGGQLCFCPGNNPPGQCPGRATMVQGDDYIPLAHRPTGGTATGLDHHRMRVRWQDNSPNEDGFVIQRWTGGGIGAVHPEIGRVGANQTEWIHTGLQPSTSYQYRVCAIPPGGDDGTVCTDSFSGTTLQAPQAPARPASIQAEAMSPTHIRVRWSAGFGGDPPTRFLIRAGRSGAPLTTLAGDLSTQTFRFDHDPVAPRETWVYEVCAANNVGTRCAQPVEATTPALPVVAVQNLQGEASHVNGQHRIVLSWSDPNGPHQGEVRTEVAKFSSETSSFMTVETSEGTGANARIVEYVETGATLRSDTEYRYRVCTRNLPESGTHRPCAEVNMRTVDAGLDVGTMTLRAHLEELRRVDVQVLQPGGRAILPPGESCTSCPWIVATRELGATLQRAGVQGEVDLAVVNARGAVVAALGRFSVARDGSIPGLARDLQVDGRAPLASGEQCGFDLLVRDGRGQELSRAPFCLNRTGGRD